MCYKSRYYQGWTLTEFQVIWYYRAFAVAYGRTIWQCSCTGNKGTVISDGYSLGFDLIKGGTFYESWSPQTVYLRFQGVDAAFNSSLLSARLRVFATDTTCSAASTIRIWADLSTNSTPFRPYRQGALSARNRTTTFVDWNVGDGWKWAYRQEESVDISPVLKEIFQNEGWRSGNSLTLILRQQVTVGGGACQFLSSEAGKDRAPLLRISLADAANQTTSNERTVRCDMELEVALSPSASVFVSKSCDDALSVTESRYYPTMSSDLPDVGSVSVVPSVACCPSFGHPAFLALDSDQSTYWRSPRGYLANFTLDLGESGAIVSRVSISWTTEFASNYTVRAWVGGSWIEVYNKTNGDGNVDDFDVETFSSQRRISSLRIEMISNESKLSERAYGIYEIVVYGCGQLSSGTLKTYTENAVQLLKSLSPSIASISPTMGSTAGGKVVNITGWFGAQLKSQLSVDFGGLPCSILLLEDIAENMQTITCRSFASGVVNGGLKYVRVVSTTLGASVLSEEFVFNYIDAWSARTTWGGNAPPIGCGDYVVDPDCQETIVIPAGQVVLLDVSPPRIFLLLIQGTLIFDRKDLHLQVLSTF